MRREGSKLLLKSRFWLILIGEGLNQDTPKFSIRENAVQVRIPREHVVWDDPLVTRGQM